MIMFGSVKTSRNGLGTCLNVNISVHKKRKDKYVTLIQMYVAKGVNVHKSTV